MKRTPHALSFNMTHDRDHRLRTDLVNLLDGKQAHLTFDDAVRDVTGEELGRPVPETDETGRPHTVWRLVEHLRFTQRDILEYVRGKGYVAPEWPDAYWPAGDAPEGSADERMTTFARTCDAFRADLAALRAMAEDPAVDPLAPIPHAGGTTLVRNILLAADHNAYHLGQLVAVRKVLGTWRA